jgi:hypothetical protein
MSSFDVAKDHTQMVQKVVPTYCATIYVGMKEKASGQSTPQEKLFEYLREYIGTHGRGSPAGCISVTPTKYFYVDGCEDGFAIGFINYPRFPASPEAIRASAMQLGTALAQFLHQCRVSIVFPDETVMITRNSGHDDSGKG